MLTGTNSSFRDANSLSLSAAFPLSVLRISL